MLLERRNVLKLGTDRRVSSSPLVGDCLSWGTVRTVTTLVVSVAGVSVRVAVTTVGGRE
jgi:hypothetical protein